MAKKEVTNEKLARMIQKGFLEVKSEISGVKSELKSEINDVRSELKTEIREVKLDTEQIKRQQFAEIERNDRQDTEIKEVKTRVGVLEKQVS